MTDKERLEEIAYNVGVSIDGEKAIMSSDDYDFLYSYALEQTERVQELESRIADDEHFVVEILEQNKRYKQALEFYADEENYKGEHGRFWRVVVEGGKRARKALGVDKFETHKNRND